MADEPSKSTDQLTFSQRHGYEPLPQAMRLEELSDNLRIEIFNAVRSLFLGIDSNSSQFLSVQQKRLIECVSGEFLGQTEDTIIKGFIPVSEVPKRIKEAILKDKFNRILDLIEITIKHGFIVPEMGRDTEIFVHCVHDLFQKHSAPYRLDISHSPHHFLPICSKEQGDLLLKDIRMIQNGGMEGAETHLRQAANHLNKQQFANSVKESISAVESVARRISPRSKTLGVALNSLEKNGVLTNKQLKDGFEKLYAYTNSEEGVRHSLVFKDSPDIGLDEAVFMFGSCASFAAYLVSKYIKMD